jgi:hypothetical protein
VKLMRCLILPLTVLCVACGGSTNTAHDAGAGHAGSSAVCTYDPRVPPPANCPNDVPSDCPAAPSYSTTVSQVIAKNCHPCHRAGGLALDRPFETYMQVYDARTTMLNRVTRCIMPPACAPQQPSTTERHDLLQWLVCSAPNN